MIQHHPPGIRFHHSLSSVAHRLMDALIIVLGLWSCVEILGVSWSSHYAAVALLATVLFMVGAESTDLYHFWRQMPVLYVWVLVGVGLLIVGYATKSTSDFSRLAMSLWAVGTPLGLIGYRLALRKLLSFLHMRGFSMQTVAIGGANAHGCQFAQYLQRNPALGLRLLGFFDDREPGYGDDRLPSNLPAPLLGSFQDLVECAYSGRIDVIYILLPLKAQDRIAQLIQRLADAPVAVYLVPDFFVFDLLHAQWINIGNMPTISIFETPLSGVNGLAKRVEDVVLSMLILVLIAAPMVVIALAVKRSSPGPVLFKQTRYGLDGRKINIWKFRTMTVCEDGNQVVQAQRNDRRVTPLGAFLRRTSLDELPQFFNVLMGQMSIVGPRPHAVAHNEQYRKLIPGYMLRHKVKPGITGWAQINGWRGETEVIEKMQKRVEYDLWYIRHWSLRVDLQIVAYTALRVLWDREAY